MTNNHQPIKIALGLSGGVDSALAAYLLQQQGFAVTAVFIECWGEAGCRAEQDRQDALKIALQLNIPFQVLDFKQAYHDQVLNYFLASYQQGLTPNPDVLCNNVIKFGLFYDWAINNGFQAVATGHYAQTNLYQPQLTPTEFANQTAQPAWLLTSRDQHKDQTYFLHQLRAEQLSKIIFPIGHLPKTEVRQLAHQLNFPVADKKDSVGICFIGDINVRQFLMKKLGQKKGEIITPTGQVIGHHHGHWLYTIGQRHGFSVDQKAVAQSTDWLSTPATDLPPLYILAKNPATNQLIVGPQKQIERHQLTVNQLHLIQPIDLTQIPQLLVRIRHTGELLPAAVSNYQPESITLNLATPALGVAPGQFAVLYSPASNHLQQLKTSAQYLCWGGGTIA